MLEYLKALFSQPYYANLNICSKLQFIVEEASSIFRYPLSISFLCENASSSLSKHIREEGPLTIPFTRYFKELTSAFSVKTGLFDNTIKYLEARCQKIPNLEKLGSLIEIYAAKRCELS